MMTVRDMLIRERKLLALGNSGKLDSYFAQYLGGIAAIEERLTVIQQHSSETPVNSYFAIDSLKVIHDDIAMSAMEQTRTPELVRRTYLQYCERLNKAGNDIEEAMVDSQAEALR